MLSFKNGEKIAVIVGGDKDGSYIYMNSSSQDPIDKLSKDFKNKYKSLKTSDIRKLHKALRLNESPEDAHLIKIYKEALGDLQDETSFNKLVLKNGKIQVIPRKSIIEKLYIAGVSGSGKSTYTGNYLKQFKKMFPDDNIYLFSSVAQDSALDKFDPIRVDIDESLIEDPLEIEDFQDSITIFDDTNTIRNRQLRNAVEAAQAEVIEIGRHYNARTIVTSHILQNYKQTRQILNEATSVTFFPKASGVYHIKNFLKNFIGLDKYQINKILELPSRWITIYRTFPAYLVYEKGISLLSDFN